MTDPTRPRWEVAPGVTVEVDSLGQVVLLMSRGPLTTVQIFEPDVAVTLSTALAEAGQKASQS